MVAAGDFLPLQQRRAIVPHVTKVGAAGANLDAVDDSGSVARCCRLVVVVVVFGLDAQLAECVGLLHHRLLAELLKDVSLFRVELLHLLDKQPDQLPWPR